MRNYFCGWYFKCQSDDQTLAVIPAIHKSGEKKTCSIQIITGDCAWNIELPCQQFRKDKKSFRISAAENHFGHKGIRLCLHTADCSAEGTVRFGEFSPIRYDIMGPFRYVPFMECRHMVLSMRHTVNGKFSVNGKAYRFRNGIGYIEGDRGYSFPKEYAWTQCSFDDGALMLSVADIPMGVFHFTGIIAVIHWRSAEYRLATYLGAGVVRLKDGEIIIRQGRMLLAVKLLEKHTNPLFAPIGGAMSRTVHESASCRAAYSFWIGHRRLFSFETSRASFEYEYPY